MKMKNLKFRGVLDIGDKTVTIYNYIGDLESRVSEKTSFL